MKTMRWLALWALFIPMFAFAAPPLSVYGQLPLLSDVDISPDGKRIAAVATVQGRRMLLVQELDGGAVVLKMYIDEMKLRRITWVSNDLVTAVVSSTRNLGMEYGFEHEFYNMAVFDVPGDNAHWLLEKHYSKYLNAIFGIYGFSQDGDRSYAYVGLIPLEHSLNRDAVWIGSTDVQLTRIDLLSGDKKEVARGTRGIDQWTVDRKGNVIANATYDDEKRKWRLYAGAGHQELLVEYDDIYGDNALQGQGRTPGTVLITQHDAQGGAHYMEVSLSGEQEPQEILQEQTADDFIFDTQSGLLSGIAVNSNTPELMMFDARAQARVRGVRKAFPNLNVDFRSWSDDFDRLVVFTEGTTDAGAWWIVDIKDGSAKELGWRYPEIKSIDVGPYELVQYKAADGLDLDGVLTLPPGGKRTQLPVVVLPHGGPEARDTLRFDWWAQAFASRGYAVWQPNFRGSAGYGIAFRNAGLGQWGRKMQTDISDGLAYLAKEGIVDPKRACIVGASYGGYAALAGVTVQQGLYKCAVSVAGVADLKNMLAEERRTARENVTRYWRDFMGAHSLLGGELDAISPSRLVDRADAPVLLIHGKDDTVVPLSQSKTMYRALRSANKPVELIELEGEDHWMSRASTRSRMLDAAVKWVEKYNPPAL